LAAVSRIDGATALTRTLSLATSSASATVSAATAALLAAAPFQGRTGCHVDDAPAGGICRHRHHRTAATQVAGDEVDIELARQNRFSGRSDATGSKAAREMD